MAGSMSAIRKEVKIRGIRKKKPLTNGRFRGEVTERARERPEAIHSLSKQSLETTLSNQAYLHEF